MMITITITIIIMITEQRVTDKCEPENTDQLKKRKQKERE